MLRVLESSCAGKKIFRIRNWKNTLEIYKMMLNRFAAEIKISMKTCGIVLQLKLKLYENLWNRFAAEIKTLESRI
jgi:hypothetical protein